MSRRSFSARWRAFSATAIRKKAAARARRRVRCRAPPCSRVRPEAASRSRRTRRAPRARDCRRQCALSAPGQTSARNRGIGRRLRAGAAGHQFRADPPERRRFGRPFDARRDARARCPADPARGLRPIPRFRADVCPGAESAHCRRQSRALGARRVRRDRDAASGRTREHGGARHRTRRRARAAAFFLMAVAQKARQRAETLRRDIEAHNYRYYVLDAPTIPDAAYDKLFGELVELEKVHPELLTPDSPTQRVGGMPLEEFPQVTHRTPMLSLNNAFSDEDVIGFDRRVREGLGKDEIEYAAA